MKRFSVVPHGTGAAHMPSEFTDYRATAIEIYWRMLADGANSVLIWDDFDSEFVTPDQYQDGQIQMEARHGL